MSQTFTSLDDDFSSAKELYYAALAIQGKISGSVLQAPWNNLNEIRENLVQLWEKILSAPVKIYRNNRGSFNFLTLLLSSNLLFHLLRTLIQQPLSDENVRLLTELLWWLLYSSATPSNVWRELDQILKQELKPRIDRKKIVLDICSIFKKLTNQKASCAPLYLSRSTLRLDFLRLALICLHSEHSQLGPLSFWSSYRNQLPAVLLYFVQSKDSLSSMATNLEMPPLPSLEHLLQNILAYLEDAVFERVIDRHIQIPSFFSNIEEFEIVLRLLSNNSLIERYSELIDPRILRGSRPALRSFIISDILKGMNSIEKPSWIRYSDYCANAKLINPLNDQIFDNPVNIAYGIPGNRHCYSLSDLDIALTFDASNFAVPDYVAPQFRDSNYPEAFGLNPLYELGPSFNLVQARQLRDFLLQNNIVVSSNISYSPTFSPSDTASSFLAKLPLGQKVQSSNFNLRLNKYIDKLTEEENRWENIQAKYEKLLPIDAVLTINYLFELFRLSFLFRQSSDLPLIDILFLKDLRKDIAPSLYTFLNSLPLVSTTLSPQQKLEELRLPQVLDSCLRGEFCRAGTADVLYETTYKLLNLLLKLSPEEFAKTWEEWQKFTFAQEDRIATLRKDQVSKTGHFLRKIL